MAADILNREHLALVAILLPLIPAAFVAWVFTPKSTKRKLFLLSKLTLCFCALLMIVSCGAPVKGQILQSSDGPALAPETSATNPAFTLTAAQVFPMYPGMSQTLRNGYGDLTYIAYEYAPTDYVRPDVCPAALPMLVMHFTKTAARAYHFSKETWFVICQQSDGSWISPKALMMLEDGSNLTLEVTSGSPSYTFVPAGSIAGQSIDVNAPYTGYFFGGLSWPSVITLTASQVIPWQTHTTQGLCPVTSGTNGTEQCVFIRQQENCPGLNCDDETWAYAPGVGPVQVQPNVIGLNPVDPNLTTRLYFSCGQKVNGVTLACPTLAP